MRNPKLYVSGKRPNASCLAFGAKTCLCQSKERWLKASVIDYALGSVKLMAVAVNIILVLISWSQVKWFEATRMPDHQMNCRDLTFLQGIMIAVPASVVWRHENYWYDWPLSYKCWNKKHRGSKQRPLKLNKMPWRSLRKLQCIECCWNLHTYWFFVWP